MQHGDLLFGQHAWQGFRIAADFLGPSQSVAPTR
jgi:hypothetical protein